MCNGNSKSIKQMINVYMWSGPPSEGENPYNDYPNPWEWNKENHPIWVIYPSSDYGTAWLCLRMFVSTNTTGGGISTSKALHQL